MHAVCDGVGQPLVLLLSGGRISDHTGPGCGSAPGRRRASWSSTAATTATSSAPPPGPWRSASPPAATQPQATRSYYPDTSWHRHRIENTFTQPRDRRRVATRYDRCADLFRADVALAATVSSWLKRRP